MAGRKKQHIDWGVWIRSFGVVGLGIIGLLITFYFSTTNSLTTTREILGKHDAQFAEVGKKFDAFNDTMKKNYDDWAKRENATQEKADRVREQFIATFNNLGIQSAQTQTQVNNIAKQLDSVTTKLDSIQDVQRQNRHKMDDVMPPSRR